MLLSELEERGRRFKLALRVGVPIFILISITVYVVLLKEKTVDLDLESVFLLGGIVFISIYFIYFLLEQDSKETLVDRETHGFNQKAFERKLKGIESKTVALLSINNLGSIDENYGTNDTNKLLRSIVQSLNQSFANDGIFQAIIGRRFGSDFLVAIDTNQGNLRELLKKFIANNLKINNIDIEYQFSIIAYGDEKLETIITHLKDKLLGTKNYEPLGTNFGLDTVASEASISETEAAVVDAIKEKSLQLSFRPLEDIMTGDVNIYEVAVMLRSHSVGNILPRVYLPIVNRLGLGREYDLSIVERLVSLLPLLDDHISFTFNISPFSLRNKGFQDRLFKYLDAKSIDNSRLIIELYERKTFHDLSGYFQTLALMRSRGLKIAIDNFGSSNASMEYMKHFRFDMVQFDRDYVTKLDDKLTYEMFRSLVQMSKKLDIKTIAKWVDRDSQKVKLKELGVNYIQGFGVSKPICEEELIKRYN